MGLSSAYAVDGGRINGAMFRTVAWAATSGANGVVNGSDLRVTALAVPAGKININPGGAVITNRFAGSSTTQSYVAASDSVTQLDIPATTSGGGRTDYIILRIDDWHFTGAPAPTDPVNELYCRFDRVTSLTGINYPYVVLAKIVLPASTGTITSSMITDMREVANPRTKRVLRANAVLVSETETLANTTGEYFPNAGSTQIVAVPEWATRVKIRADWMGLLLPQGDCNGRLWVSFGDWNGKSWGDASQDFGFSNAGVGFGDLRTNASVVDDMYVPPALRGRDVHFQMWAKKVGKEGARMDWWSGVALDLLFEEIADPSST